MVNYDDGANSSLRAPHCVITTHDEEGKATVYERLAKSDEISLKHIDMASFSVLYATRTFPVDFNGDNDLKDFLTPGIKYPLSLPGGTVLRMVDQEPQSVSPLHRTVSLDYGVVIEGEVELILEDLEKGPRKLLKQGDVCVQRGTIHAWRNPSPTKWSRMLFILQDAKPVKAHGKELGDDSAMIGLPEQ